jgi:hypothetical protein
MSNVTAEQQQHILKEYRRRRTLELLISIPMLAGVFVLVLMMRRPGYEIAGFGGTGLMVTAGAVGVAGFFLYGRNARCPACERPLRRGLFGSTFCRRCGAVFVTAGRGADRAAAAYGGAAGNPGTAGTPGAAKAAADRQAAERALGRELERYRTRVAKRILISLLLLVPATAFAFFFSPSEGPHQDLWLVRTFGPHAPAIAGRLFGVAAMLFAFWQLYRCWRWMARLPAFEAQSRRTLGLPPAGSGAPTAEHGAG